jgi:hypothetical protein
MAIHIIQSEEPVNGFFRWHYTTPCNTWLEKGRLLHPISLRDPQICRACLATVNTLRKDTWVYGIKNSIARSSVNNQKKKSFLDTVLGPRDPIAMAEAYAPKGD